MKAVIAGLTASSVLVSGCASIVKGGSQDLVIDSPQGAAQFELRDRKGQVSTIKGTTPATVTLRRGTGFFSGAAYEVEISRPGYETRTVQIDSRVSGWYLGGNLLLGGLIGYLVVDPATGAMWRLEPEELDIDLVPLAVASNPQLAQWAEVAVAAEPPLARPVSASMPAQTAPATAGDVPPAEPVAAKRPQAPPAALAPVPDALPVAAASVAAPLATPVVTAVPVAAPNPAAAPGATMTMPRQTAVYPQPRVADAQIRILPAGYELTLESTLGNADGRWWFVRGAGVAGWVLDAALTP